MADDDARARRVGKSTTGSPAKRAAAKKVVVGKAAAKKAPVKKAPVKKAPLKKAAVRKAPAAAKAPARKLTSQTPRAQKAASTPPPARDRGAILSPRTKAPPRLRLAAEQTFDDDWEEPAPKPVREDPGARIRGLIRAAALRLEENQAAAGGRAAPAPRPVAPPADPDEPVTRVLVAPASPEPELGDDFDDDLEDDDFEDDDFEDEVDEGDDFEDEEDFEEEDFEDEPDEDDDDDDPDAELKEELEVAEDDLDEDEDEDEWDVPEVLDDGTSTPRPPPPRPAPPPRTWTPPPAPKPEPPAPTQTFEPAPHAAATFEPAPYGKRKSGRGIRWSVVAVVLLVVVLLVGGGTFAYLALREDGVDYSKLKVGDCFDSAVSNEVRGVKVKPCAEPHNSEIFFLVNHPAPADAPYPGKDALVQFAADACLGQPLTEYLGVPMEQSKLKDFEIVPQESAWKDGRRVLVCGVDTGVEGGLEGSVKGTRR